MAQRLRSQRRFAPLNIRKALVQLALIALAQFLRRNRDAKPAGGGWSCAALDRFVAVANQFADELNRLDFEEEQTAAACRYFVETVELLERVSLRPTKASNRALVQALQIARPESLL